MPLLEQKRLFVAIELPKNIKQRLESIQKELKRSGADAKWVEPENIHLTLKFLGNVDAENIKNMSELLKSKFSLKKSFKITLDRLGCFPSLHSPRVLWAGFEDKQDNTKEMARLFEETKEFQPHATLARVRSPLNKIALIEKMEELNRDFKPEALDVDNITLFESKLSSKGPAYSIIQQIKFL